jgi:hypothetical protein
MRLLLLLAADYANITGEGKLNVMGVFNEIRAPNFPARQPSMHLVVKLAAELGEYGQTRHLTVRLLDADGKEMVSISGPIEIPKAEGGVRPEVNAIFDMKDVVFPQAGPYQFVVLVDKDYKGDLPINARKVEPQPTPKAPAR